MARKPKAVETATDDRIKLLNALAFVSVAIDKADEGRTSFVAFRDRWLTSENDTLSIGIGVDIDLELCPQADKFRAALQQCGQQFQLTQIDKQAVSLKSGNFRALVPALPADMASVLAPDAPCAAIDDRLRLAFEACSKTMSAKGDRIFNKSVLLRSGTMVGTNGGIAVEYWHGIDLPGPLAIPKKAVETLIKISKPMAAFGFSDHSVTFYFEDGSYLKTRIMSEQWPDVDRLYSYMNAPFRDVWPELFAGLKAIDAFVQNDTVFFHKDYIATSNSLELGASYRVENLPEGYVFSAAYWRAIEPFVSQVQLSERPGAPFGFMGANVRGLLMGKTH